MSEKKEVEVINLKNISRRIWKEKKKFYRPMAVVFVLSCVYIFSLPRYYATDAKLTPEMSSSLDGGALGSIASAFGFNFGDAQTADAINPLLYPDLMEDNAFVAKLFDIPVETMEGDVKTTYYDYLKKRQKQPWWGGAKSWFLNLFKSKPKDTYGQGEFNPYTMSKTQSEVADVIRGNISLSVDKKTGVITVNIKDQDPLICKTLGDTLISQLQEFITDYRTNKSRVDMEYYSALVDSARNEYTEAYRKYAAFADANTNVVLQRYQTRLADLENDMQLKYQTYSALMTQLQAAKGKVQERTPVFTILKGAAIPVKPAGPKRVIFVAMMLILAFLAKSFWMVRNDLHIKF